MKKLGSLVLVLAILLSVFFYQRMRQSEIIVSEPVETLQVNPDRVSKLRIVRPNEPEIELSRIGGGWRITEPFEYEAQEQIVSNTLKQLEELALDDVVSSNPGNRGTFQVDSTGTHVVAWEGDEKVLDLVVGKTAPDFAHTYVRPNDGDQVYRAKSVLTYSFNRKPDDWRNKTILQIDEGTITQVKLSYLEDKDSVVLAKADSLWNYTSGGKTAEADSATVARLLRSASNLTTVSFVGEEEAAAEDFSKPDFALEITTDSGSHAVEFFNVDDNRFYATQEKRQGIVFQVYKSTLTNLMKKGEDFAAPAS